MKHFCRLAACAVLVFFTVMADAQNRPFKVAQSMHYKGGADLSADGVPYNPIVYERSLVPNANSDTPASQEAMKAVLSSIKPGPFPTVLDVERWPIETPDLEKRKDHIERLIDMLKRAKEARPDMQYGYYGTLPIRVYWPVTGFSNPALRSAWQKLNDQGVRALMPHVDALFPSLYHFDDDASRWESNTRMLLTEGRKFGKPMYCYLSPQFHPSNKQFAGKYLSRELWRSALKTCHELADGIVIWAYAPKTEWDPQAPWWQETLAFLRAHGLSAR